MFEHQFQPLLPRLRFLRRFLRSLSWGLAVIAASLVGGMIGYHVFEHLNWIDSFLNASMILSGMGPVHSPASNTGKLFAGFYALYSGFVVILATGIVFAPVVHRFLHRFHISTQEPKARTAASHERRVPLASPASAAAAHSVPLSAKENEDV